MTGKELHVWHQLSRPLRGGRSADTTSKGDAKAAVSALVGPDNQLTWGNGAVESGPVEVLERVVQLAGDRGHRCHPVGFAFEKGVDGPKYFGVAAIRRGRGHPARRTFRQDCAARLAFQRGTHVVHLRVFW